MQKKDFINVGMITYGKDYGKQTSESAKLILKNNIIQGDFLKKVFDIKFDVIIGNPPYCLIDGGGRGDSAKPIYQLFIQQAKNIVPRYLLMIVPSRWMKGGKGLDKFRDEMMNDTRIKFIYDYEDSSECFPEVRLDGGVNYFLWDSNYNGKCEYHYKKKNGNESVLNRYLKNDISKTIVRDYRQIPIIEKANKFKEPKFSEICSYRNPFGLYADLFKNPNKYPDIDLEMQEDKSKIKVYGIIGKKGGKRVSGYVNQEGVKKNKTDILKYKIFFSKAYATTSTTPPKMILGKPNTACTETFLEIGPFDTENEAKNCLAYMSTKFFRALLFYNRSSLNISKKTFDLIPLQDFLKTWTDEELYSKYDLTKDEISFIEENIKPIKTD